MQSGSWLTRRWLRVSFKFLCECELPIKKKNSFKDNYGWGGGVHAVPGGLYGSLQPQFFWGVGRGEIKEFDIYVYYQLMSDLILLWPYSTHRKRACDTVI